MTNPLDWTKPIQTRDGCKARVWDEPMSDGRRVVVVGDEGQILHGYPPDGKYHETLKGLDIINAPEPERWGWFLIGHLGEVVHASGDTVDSEQLATECARIFNRSRGGTLRPYIAKLIPVEPEKENDDG